MSDSRSEISNHVFYLFYTFLLAVQVSRCRNLEVFYFHSLPHVDMNRTNKATKIPPPFSKMRLTFIKRHFHYQTFTEIRLLFCYFFLIIVHAFFVDWLWANTRRVDALSGTVSRRTVVLQCISNSFQW